ncbi:MAG: hypothetical protein M0Z46_16485 [Actinomycetota bacterium]|jgi:hypothetical protein|nr:hypothetical protein [Actinomycetota bacterium]
MDAEAYADMLPWLVFVVVDRKLGLGVAWAGGGALACSLGLVTLSYWRGRPSMLPRVALGVFALCLASGLAFHGWDHQVGLPRALAVASLSLVAFGSLPFTPLSEAYTVPLVAPGVRDDPRFREVNVQMTLTWGVGSLVVAAACGTTAILSGPVLFTLLDWVAPLVLGTATILWAARRWEQFRLSVEPVAAGRLASEAGDLRLVARDVRGRGGQAPDPRVSPRLELVVPRDGRTQEAVVRRLPAHGRGPGPLVRRPG